MINKHKSNKIKENSNTVRHWNNGTDHRHSKSCCDKSSPARRTTRRDASSLWCLSPGDWQNVSLHGSSIIQSRSWHEDSGSNEPEQLLAPALQRKPAIICCAFPPFTLISFSGRLLPHPLTFRDRICNGHYIYWTNVIISMHIQGKIFE